MQNKALACLVLAVIGRLFKGSVSHISLLVLLKKESFFHITCDVTSNELPLVLIEIY